MRIIMTRTAQQGKWRKNLVAANKFLFSFSLASLIRVGRSMNILFVVCE
jgi:hypothetical protein